MRRTQIQLDEKTYALAKQRAFAESKSLAAIVREALAHYLTTSSGSPTGPEGFSFIGSGRSRPDSPIPLSERHDEALAEDFAR